MADEKGRLEKIAKLLEAAAELEEKRAAVMQEIAALASGKPGIGQRLKDLRQAFSTAWATRYAGAYQWNFGKDDALAKKLLARHTVEEIAQRAAKFVRDSDPFLVRAGHTFGLFYTSVNRYAEISIQGDPGDLDLESDADATAKNLRKMRGE